MNIVVKNVNFTLTAILITFLFLFIQQLDIYEKLVAFLNHFFFVNEFLFIWLFLLLFIQVLFVGLLIFNTCLIIIVVIDYSFYFSILF